jgi:peptidoglycan/LPS O-acetylase OafA/YrhL
VSETHVNLPISTVAQGKGGPGRQYNLPLGYLRAFIILLVLAHHSALAYHPYAPKPPVSFSAASMSWAEFPIVDSRRWHGSWAFVAFNDNFFMALLFFLSGLFVWPSLARKGVGKYLRDRALRLGLPFAVMAGLLAPLAYYPSYRTTGADPGFMAFWRAWMALGSWPAGPAWFIWVLLAFCCIAALFSKLVPKWGEALGRFCQGAGRYPVVFFGLLVVLSALAYVPMALAFGPMSWTHAGPFYFQTSRIFLYALYFFAGIGTGAGGTGRGLLAPDGGLARRWYLWLIASLGAFALTFPPTVGALTRGHPWPERGTITDFAYVLSSAASGFAFLAVFLRFARRSFTTFDSLGDNSYGIYLTHYVFVIWLQYSLLPAPLPGLAKASLVFAGTLALSWGVTASMRRIPAVARVL